MEYQELLKLWDLKAYISTFDDEGITDESFLLLDEATIKSIFKKIGTYGKFNIADPKIMIAESLKEFTDSTADPVGPPDSHEAMNNRELNPKQREKRSFEFLVGLINNNSKYEVVRSDPELFRNKEMPKKSDNTTSDATSLLLELLSKIVTYPDHWRRIHQVLRNLDDDLISSQHILKYQMEKQNLKNQSPDIKRKTDENIINTHNEWTQNYRTETNKWPTFDDYEEVTKPITQTESLDPGLKNRNSEKSSYQKSFAYHKVTGKPTHLKKNPTAYIAVSAISPKPSNSEEDFMLETELHQLKPWKNKNSLRKV